MSNKKPKNLNNYLNKVIEHKTLSCIIALLMFVLPLIVVHFLFKWNSNIEWIQAEWDAGDVISYIAGFEAFIGTTFLSFLALWQNQQHKQENDNKDKMLLDVENEKIRLSNLPQFLIQTADYKKAVDPNARISAPGQDVVVLDYLKTHGFFVNSSGTYWIPYDKIPGIERSQLNKLISVVNCGNNTAHQVKLSININGKEYPDEKALSVKKDEELYLYIGIDNNASMQDDLILTLRYFDCFQNVYEQEFSLKNEPECIYFKSYSDVKLISKNKSMEFTIQP